MIIRRLCLNPDNITAMCLGVEEEEIDFVISVGGVTYPLHVPWGNHMVTLTHLVQVM